MTGQSFFTVMQIFFSLSPVAIYVIAGYLVTGSGDLGGISAGTIVTFTTLQSRLFFPIGSLMQVSVELQASLALFERIFNYLDIKPDIVDYPGAVKIDPKQVRARIAFDSVRLSYKPQDGDGSDPSDRRWALDGVSFEIEPGQLAALPWGPAGRAKTTISYLIPRLYDPTNGSVRIDGIDVREIEMESLANLFGYVTQESYLFHASIHSNMLYGNPNATTEEIGGCRQGRLHTRQDNGLPRRIRHSGGRTWLSAVGRRTPAPVHRPGYPARPPRADPGRGHLGPGYRQRTPGAGGPGAPDERPHDHQPSPTGCRRSSRRT